MDYQKKLLHFVFKYSDFNRTELFSDMLISSAHAHDWLDRGLSQLIFSSLETTLYLIGVSLLTLALVCVFSILCNLYVVSRMFLSPTGLAQVHVVNEAKMYIMYTNQLKSRLSSVLCIMLANSTHPVMPGCNILIYVISVNGRTP